MPPYPIRPPIRLDFFAAPEGIDGRVQAVHVERNPERAQRRRIRIDHEGDPTIERDPRKFDGQLGAVIEKRP